MLYWFSIAAIKFNGKGMIVDTMPVTVRADSYEEASAKAMDICKKRCPPDEQWMGHTVEGVLG